MTWRLAALNFGLRTFGRPVIKHTKSAPRARRDLTLTSRLFFRGPRGHARRRELGGVRVRDISPPGADTENVLLYFHGGGYVAGSSRTHLPMLGYLAKKAGARAVLPDYRLAPEAPFPAAFDDAVAVWRGLRSEGVPADHIILGGDSAGGGLALALLSHVLSEGERPAGLFGLSPWTDLTLSGPSLAENAKLDAILPGERVEELRDMVAPGIDPADPRISPLFAGFEGAPPVYLQVSETEILRDDALRMADRLKEQGVDVQVDTWPDTPHVWHLFLGWIPEADEALGGVAEFTQNCFKSAPRQSEN